MNLPDEVGRWAVAAAGVVWTAAWAGRSFGFTAVVVALVVPAVCLALGKRWLFVLAVIAVAGSLSGVFSSQRDQAILESFVPEGVVEVGGVAVEDPRPSPIGAWFLMEPEYLSTRDRVTGWDGPRLLVSIDQPGRFMAGDRLAVTGRLEALSGEARGDVYAGRITARTVERISEARGFFRAANLIRSRVEDQLSETTDRPAAALVSGFLIGDVRELPRPDYEALRRAGLSHFVAVSGSNVALFLILWWVIVGLLVSDHDVVRCSGWSDLSSS